MNTLHKKRTQHLKESAIEKILTTQELASYLRLTEATVCNLAAF
jgi:hypothetical protein